MFFATTAVSLLLSLSTLVSQTTAQTTGDASTQKLNWSGRLSSLDAGLGGIVTVTSPTTLTITNYELDDASAPALYWWGSQTSSLRNGFRISRAQVTSRARSDTLEIPLDLGRTSADFVTVGLWCERFSTNFGQALLADGNGTTSTASGTTGSPSEAAAKTSNGGESLKAGLKSSLVVGAAVAALAGGVAVLIV